MRSFMGCCLTLALSAGLAIAGPPAEPFGILMDAARQSAETRETVQTMSATTTIKAFPGSLGVPRPEPAPPRTAVHAHVAPDGNVTYECRLADEPGEGRP